MAMLISLLVIMRYTIDRIVVSYIIDIITQRIRGFLVNYIYILSAVIIILIIILFSKKRRSVKRHINIKQADTMNSTYDYIENNMNIDKVHVYSSDLDPVYKEKIDDKLLPGEIVLLEWIENKSISIAEFPQYFSYEYGIDPANSVRFLIDNNYIKTAGLYDSLMSFKVVELKDILKANSLAVSGKKNELINRIKFNISADILNEYVKDKFFAHTELGSSLIRKHTHLLFAHSNRTMFSVGEVIRFMKENDLFTTTVEQLSQLLIMQKIQNDFKPNRNYGLVRNGFLHLGQLNKKFENIDDSIVSFIAMFIFDVSGWRNGNYYHENNIYADSHKIARRLISERIDSVRLKGYFDRAWLMTESFFPKHYLGKEKTFECLVASFEEDEETIRILLNLDNRKKRDYSEYFS